ncbi:MAG TPA: hypothetical protein VFS23_15760, partial [Vicinamibacterales bacterium]|nr:hypothetical protein [Vicinamibacterales bacterium]
MTHSSTFALALAFTFGCAVSLPTAATAGQDQPLAPLPVAAAPRSPVGVDIFGGVGFSWPAANDTFEALDLDVPSLEYGGGVRITNLWRSLFAQVAVNRWTDTGERAFVDSEGNSFPLGIPLDVETTFIDATIGWKAPMWKRDGSIAAWTFVGGGAGVAMYSESSPFAEPGDDIDESKVSYHVLAGGEIPIAGRLAFTFEGRYRYVPSLLGEGGASEAFGEETFGGFGVGAGLRIGFGGPAQPVARKTGDDTPAPPTPPPALGTIPVQPATVGTA